MYTQLALSIQLNSISATACVQRSSIVYIHQPHTFNAAQLGTYINRIRSTQRNWVYSLIVYFQRSVIEYNLHRTTEYIPMIPPVRTDPVWGRAQSGPVPPEGWTGPGPRLAVLDWTGLVWTSPNRIIFINFKVDPKNSRSETAIPATLTQTQPEGRSAAKA